MYPSNKPWLIPHIKDMGDMMKYKQLQEKTVLLISKAKLNYYRSKTAIARKRNPAKWFKSIYSLPNNLSTENVFTIAEKLKDVFTSP